MANDPDLRFFGFSLWVESRQFPEATDFWDGNLLIARASMEAYGASINCTGPFLMTTDIKEFRDQLVLMYETLEGEAALTPAEPELRLVF